MFRKLYREANQEICAPKELKERTVERLRQKTEPRKLTARRYALAAAALVLLAASCLFASRFPQVLSGPVEKADDVQGESGALYSSATANGAVRTEKAAAEGTLLASPQAENKQHDANKEEMEPVFQESVSRFSYQSAAQILGDVSTQKNSAYSPLSLYMGLSMLAESTQGDTQQEILTVLQATDMEEISANTPALLENQTVQTESSVQKVANSVWLRNGGSYNKNFLQTLADRYQSQSYSVDFGTSGSAGKIANWVNENTGGKLGSDAGAFETEADTEVMLLNTVYLKAPWTVPFEKNKSYQGSFYLTEGGISDCTYMEKIESGPFVTNEDGTTAAQLTMSDNTTMQFFLPSEGSSVESLLQEGNTLQALSFSLLKSSDSAKVTFQIPRFSYTVQNNLEVSLRRMGVERVFEKQLAGYFHFTEAQPLYVKSIRQDATVSVDENGCEAAAYTAISAAKTALKPDERKERMTLDRPFVYTVVHDSLPVFIGIVNDPSKE